jgi:hypothetical protein
MREYETAHLFKEMMELLDVATMNYVSVLFALLVASYLVAARLNKVMAGIVVGLFSLFALIIIFTVHRTMAGASALIGHARRAAAQGDASLNWHPMVSEPANFVEVFTPIYTATLIASFVAVLVFFFHSLSGKVSI